MRLVSEDLQGGRPIAGVAIENPFGAVRWAELARRGQPLNPTETSLSRSCSGTDCHRSVTWGRLTPLGYIA